MTPTCIMPHNFPQPFSAHDPVPVLEQQLHLAVEEAVALRAQLEQVRGERDEARSCVEKIALQLADSLCEADDLTARLTPAEGVTIRLSPDGVQRLQDRLKLAEGVAQAAEGLFNCPPSPHNGWWKELGQALAAWKEGQ